MRDSGGSDGKTLKDLHFVKLRLHCRFNLTFNSLKAMIENYFYHNKDSKFTSLVSIVINFAGSTLKLILETSNRTMG